MGIIDLKIHLKEILLDIQNSEFDIAADKLENVLDEISNNAYKATDIIETPGIYQETYCGLPVEGAVYIVTNDKKIVSMKTGEQIPLSDLVLGDDGKYFYRKMKIVDEEAEVDDSWENIKVSDSLKTRDRRN